MVPSTTAGRTTRAGDGGWLKKLLPKRAKAEAGPPSRINPAVREVLPSARQRHVQTGRLGEGGMATVELLVDQALQRRTAMKVLLPAMESEDQAVKAFIREAQVTGQLDHPNIAPVHDLGTTHEGRLYFTMKLLSGHTLADLVRELPDEPLSRERLFDLLEIVLKVCDALAFAHQRRVIHRDVKPDNVMIGDFGQVYLVDWGLAKLLDEPPAAAEGETEDAVSSSFRQIWGNRIIGTPAYMSPEQARGESLDQRADVFSVGALLYFLLARKPPYAGSSADEVIAHSRRGDYPPLAEAMDTPPPAGLERIIDRALAADPEARHQSVLELRQDLVAFMRGGSLPRVRFAAGEAIIRQGDPGSEAYIIVEGRCEVFRQTSAGQREALRTIGPGECFGETAIMASAPRTASVVALEETTVEKVTRDQLLEELDALKPWVSIFLRSLAERFEERETRDQG